MRRTILITSILALAAPALLAATTGCSGGTKTKHVTRVVTVVDPAPPPVTDQTDYTPDCETVGLFPEASTDTLGVYVSPNGDDSAEGTKAEPLATIEAGVELATATGKDVFVAGGRYDEDVITNVSIYGGYKAVGPVWGRCVDHDDTILQAADSIALTIDGSGEQVFVTDLDIRGGNADTNKGVLVRDSGRNSIATGAIFLNNTITGGGGLNSTGVTFQSSRHQIMVNNRIHGGNGDSSTGLIFLVSRDISLVNNVVYSGDGATSAAVRDLSDLNNSTPTTVLAANNVFMSAAGETDSYVFEYQQGVTDVYEGHVVYYGGIAYEMYNNVIYATDPAACLIRNDLGLCIDNIEEFALCEWDGCIVASDNLGLDPMFADVSAGDFTLDAASPCIDAGITPLELVTFDYWLSDFDYNPRPGSGEPDIGPVEAN